MTSTVGNYYNLAKPRMVYGNLLVAAAAFAYGSYAGFNWQVFLLMLAGLGLVMASACAYNNWADRAIDARMERTRGRAMAQNRIGTRGALLFSATLLVAGLVLLAFTTPLALAIAAAGWISYALMYTPLKPVTPYALFVGALAGATPPVVGYAAATGVWDMTALWLFAFLFIWQLPHFVAISVYRGGEYAAAGVPMFLGGPHTPGQKRAGRIVFFASLVILLAWCLALFAVSALR